MDGRPNVAVNRLLDVAKSAELSSVEALAPAVARLRGRPLTIQHFDLPIGTFGQWIETEDTDVLVVPRSALNREVTLGHEYGHMLLGHVGVLFSQFAGELVTAAEPES
ncbi:MAG: hypothetical protein JWN95_2236 [Frankiales bacterium]|nr:hypothetical protein [Frankiales bacterium]